MCYSSYCREVLMPQKAKGRLQCNNNSDRLNAREKQFPCQRASASTVPREEEKVSVGNHKTKQTSPLESTGQEVCVQICLPAARPPGLEQPSRDSPGRHHGFGVKCGQSSGTWGQLPHLPSWHFLVWQWGKQHLLPVLCFVWNQD